MSLYVSFWSKIHLNYNHLLLVNIQWSNSYLPEDEDALTPGLGVVVTTAKTKKQIGSYSPSSMTEKV